MIGRLLRNGRLRTRARRAAVFAECSLRRALIWRERRAPAQVPCQEARGATDIIHRRCTESDASLWMTCPLAGHWLGSGAQAPRAPVGHPQPAQASDARRHASATHPACRRAVAGAAARSRFPGGRSRSAASARAAQRPRRPSCDRLFAQRAALRACRRHATCRLARLLMLLVHGYRLLLKPWLGNACRFEPTCSAYALQALEQHGAVVGSYLSAAPRAALPPLVRRRLRPGARPGPRPVHAARPRRARPHPRHEDLP